MTTNYNNFKVNKMLVFQNKNCALDVNFKDGLNVIYGKNSAGKSSLLDVLIYSLGGEEINFTPIVNKCTHVLTEVQIENNFLTIYREISSKKREGLSLFYGEIDYALSSNDTEWHNFPYNSFTEKFGFSRVFYDYLNYPETVSAETSITTHQLLRLLYADQANNHLPIYRYEQWDKSEKRVAIRDYAFGLFSGELYEQQLYSKTLNKQLVDTTSKLQSFFKIVGKSSENMIEELILQEKKNYIQRHENIIKRLNTLNNSNENFNSDLDQKNIQKNLQSELSKLNKAIISLEQKYNEQQLEIIDLNNFNAELKIRSNDLNSSIASNELISNIIFDFCPCCHSKLDLISINQNDNICKLCKTPTSEDINKNNLLQMKTELNFQIQETTKLIKDEEKNIELTKEKLNEQKKIFNSRKKDFDILSNRWHSAFELELREAYRELGEVETELKNIESRLLIANEIKQLELKKDSLESSLKETELSIERMKNSSEHKLKSILNRLNENLKQLLSKDIGVQEEFLDPENIVEVSFEDNKVYVNGSGHFSQSSTIVLRHLFHLALLQLAMADSTIRLPHFLVLDGINDGGLEKDRAENLQKIIVEVCSSFEDPYQLICATSELFPIMAESESHKIEYLNGIRTFNISE